MERRREEGGGRGRRMREEDEGGEGGMRRRGGRGWEGEVGSKACVLSAKVATTFVSRRRGERRWHVDRIFTVLGDMHERKLRRRRSTIKGFRAQPPGKPVRMRIIIP